MKLIRMVNRAELGPELRRIRHEQGLTQVQVADVAGVTQATVSWVELRPEPVLLETIVGLARALHAVIVVDPLNLVYEEELRHMAGQLPRSVDTDLREDR